MRNMRGLLKYVSKRLPSKWKGFTVGRFDIVVVASKLGPGHIEFNIEKYLLDRTK